MEPPVTSRSTPWRTSTPPNDLRTPRAVRVTALIAGVGLPALLAGARVDRLDVVRCYDAVVRIDDLRLRLTFDQRDQGRHHMRAVQLGEIRGIGYPLLERLLAADVGPRRRVGALRGDPDVGE